MTRPILQSHLPNAPWVDAKRWKLPGIQPLPKEDWLIRDDVFAEQMALRDTLIASRQEHVHALLPSANQAASECLDLVLGALEADSDYRWHGNTVTRPDGIEVPLSRDAPLLTIGRLTQSDFCLLEAGPDGHVLTGAILCFPALLDAVLKRLGTRCLAFTHPCPNTTKISAAAFNACSTPFVPISFCLGTTQTYTPRQTFSHLNGKTNPNTALHWKQALYVRSERQVIRKLPISDATVFSIHTYMVPIDRLGPRERAGLSALVRHP